jgi:hypothetical protein
MNDTEFFDEIMKQKDTAAFYVAYSKATGEPYEIIPAPGCEVIDKGTGSVPIDLYERLKKERGVSNIDHICSIVEPGVLYQDSFRWLEMHLLRLAIIAAVQLS